MTSVVNQYFLSNIYLNAVNNIDMHMMYIYLQHFFSIDIDLN